MKKLFLVVMAAWAAALPTRLGAVTYYVDSASGDDANDGRSEAAAWKSLTRANAAAKGLKGGDRVLFRRGGLWRGSLRPGSGEKGNPILYSSYGEGPKPIFQQSADYSDPKDWAELEPGVWSTVRPFGKQDAGILILDHGERWGVKRMWGKHELKDDLDFWFDPEKQNVLVKHPKNPGEAFRSVEIARTTHVISEGGCHDVTYDGLCVRYGAAHGFGGGDTANIVIRNCDVYWIGGGLQYWRTNAKGERYPVRYGNGIEFWGACRNNLVERNRLWQIYDAALTNQTKDNPRHETDVTWRDNVIWQAEYSFEYWNHDPRSFTGNVLFEHNTCVDAGSCWSHAQRPNPNGAHLMFYDNSAPTTNFVVRHNVFVRTTDRSTRMFNDWRMKDAAAKDGLDLHDNLYWIPGNAIYEYHMAARDRKADPSAKPLRFGAGADAFARYVAATGLDRGSVYVEPKFRDEAKRDYRLVNGPLCPDGTVYGARGIPGLD